MIDSHLGLKLLRIPFINCTGDGPHRRMFIRMDVWAQRREIVRDICRLLGESFVEWNDAVERRVELRSTIFAPHRLPELTRRELLHCKARLAPAIKPTNQPTPDKFLYEHYTSDLDRIRRTNKNEGASSCQPAAIVDVDDGLCAACLRLCVLWNGRDSDLRPRDDR